MSVEQAKLLIDLLPTLIIYLIPGYLIIWVISFMLSQKIDKDSNLFIKSIVLSFIFITFGNSILSFGDLNIIDSNLLKVVVILISLVLGYVISKILVSNYFKRILKKLGINKSVYTNFWNEIVDTEKGLLVMVYLASEKKTYKGELRKYEECDHGDSTFLILSNYVLYNYDGEDEILNYEKDNNYRVLLNTKDISRIELFYHPESKKII